MSSNLVTGNAKHLAPLSEIQPYSEGNSTFYASPRETLKLDDCAPPDHWNSSYPVQCDSLERSRAGSVTSQDVAMQQHNMHRPVRQVRSYDVVDSEELKIVVLGDRCVGKSSLITKTAKKEFTCHYNRTCFLKFHSKTVTINGRLYVVNFWDLPNDTLVDETQCKAFCQGAMAAFVVYDLSRLDQTLPTIVEWKKMINNNVCMQNGDPIPVYLLGNKCDMEGCQKDGASFVSNNKFAAHFRTSAKTGEGIEEAVKQATKNILKEGLPVIVETPEHLKQK